jgi:hypothetical protein
MPSSNEAETEPSQLGLWHTETILTAEHTPSSNEAETEPSQLGLWHTETILTAEHTPCNNAPFNFSVTSPSPWLTWQKFASKVNVRNNFDSWLRKWTGELFKRSAVCLFNFKDLIFFRDRGIFNF